MQYVINFHHSLEFPRWSSGHDFRLSIGKARETRVRFPVEERLIFSPFFLFFSFFFPVLTSRFPILFFSLSLGLTKGLGNESGGGRNGVGDPENQLNSRLG